MSLLKIMQVNYIIAYFEIYDGKYLVAVCEKCVKFSWVWQNNNYRVPWEEGCSIKEGTEKAGQQSSALKYYWFC